MNQTPVCFSLEIKENTLIHENEKLASEDLAFFEENFMGSLEQRIIEWLESNNVTMMVDPSLKKDAYFAGQREKSCSSKKSISFKCLSLEASPYYQKHKKGTSPCMKNKCFLSPQKVQKTLNLINSNENIISGFAKTSLEKITFSETLEEIKKNQEM